ncbi:hypothetical protein HK096_000872 [Nowakowskiella sp. JEL0078]|nr:hypothetical protein HK096_000872 [Nowakowskiella sp. JEL0078]
MQFQSVNTKSPEIMSFGTPPKNSHETNLTFRDIVLETPKDISKTTETVSGLCIDFLLDSDIDDDFFNLDEDFSGNAQDLPVASTSENIIQSANSGSISKKSESGLFMDKTTLSIEETADPRKIQKLTFKDRLSRASLEETQNAPKSFISAYNQQFAPSSQSFPKPEKLFSNTAKTETFSQHLHSEKKEMSSLLVKDHPKSMKKIHLVELKATEKLMDRHRISNLLWTHNPLCRYMNTTRNSLITAWDKNCRTIEDFGNQLWSTKTEEFEISLAEFLRESKNKSEIDISEPSSEKLVELKKSPVLEIVNEDKASEKWEDF